jgi:hypothetical protein
VPQLACLSCGRQIYTVAPLNALTAEERRCPRCGAFLNTERREQVRRALIRRQNPLLDPGPPAHERRNGERRQVRRRAADSSFGFSRSAAAAGWLE